MKVSLIMPTFNSEKTIEQSILSVLNQSYSNIELIIVDGLSTDSTLSIIKKFESSINTIIVERDDGIYDAMNKGIKIASGEVIGILNSDDLYFDSQVIEVIVNTFLNNREIDAVYGNLYYFSGNDYEKPKRVWRSVEYSVNFFEKGHVMPHPTLFVKRKLYQTVGLYNPKFKISSDYEWMLRAFKVSNFKPHYLDKFIVKMRLGGESTKSIYNILIGNKEIVISWMRYMNYIPFMLMPRRVFLKVFQKSRSTI